MEGFVQMLSSRSKSVMKKYKNDSAELNNGIVCNLIGGKRKRIQNQKNGDKINQNHDHDKKTAVQKKF